MTEKVRTQQTDKTWKVMLIIGTVMFWGSAPFCMGEEATAGFGMVLAVLGFSIISISRLGAWWSNG